MPKLKANNIVLSEGRYSKIISEIVKNIIITIKENGDSLEEFSHYEEIEISNGKNIEVVVYIEKENNIETPFWINAECDDEEISIDVHMNESRFPESFKNLVAELKDCLRHELIHIGQFIRKENCGIVDTSKRQNFVDYCLSKDELPAYLAGFYLKARTKKITMNQAIDEYLRSYGDVLEDGWKREIRKRWTKYGMWKYPQAIWEG